MKEFMNHDEFEKLIAPYVVKIIDDDNEKKFRYVITKRIKCNNLRIEDLEEEMAIKKNVIDVFEDVEMTVMLQSEVKEMGTGSTGIPLGLVKPVAKKVNNRKKETGPRAKRKTNSMGCVTPLGTFGSFAAAAIAHGKSQQNIRSLTMYHVAHGNPGWKIIEAL